MKKVLTIVAVIFLVICAGSGWVYRTVESRNDAKTKELSVLGSAFMQRYGTDATIKQLVRVDKVYTAYWTKLDGTSCVSWCIGGVWATVYIGQAPETITSP